MCTFNSPWGPLDHHCHRYSDGIPVGLYIACHEAFEVGLLHAILFYHVVEFSLYNALDLCVLQLHVIYGNGHDLAINALYT
jgi:hypothetical protein